MNISKKIIKLLYSVEKFCACDNREVYYMIKQEIKYNPELKNVRFMNEQKFNQLMELGKKNSRKCRHALELYNAVEYVKQSFFRFCKNKWYNDMINKPLSENQNRYLLRWLDYYDESTIQNKRRVKINDRKRSIFFR